MQFCVTGISETVTAFQLRSLFNLIGKCDSIEIFYLIQNFPGESNIFPGFVLENSGIGRAVFSSFYKFYDQKNTEINPLDIINGLVFMNDKLLLIPDKDGSFASKFFGVSKKK